MILSSFLAAFAFPTEPASIFTMILLVVCVLAVFWFGRGARD